MGILGHSRVAVTLEVYRTPTTRAEGKRSTVSASSSMAEMHDGCCHFCCQQAFGALHLSAKRPVTWVGGTRFELVASSVSRNVRQWSDDA